jgi:hypothetical protein
MEGLCGLWAGRPVNGPSRPGWPSRPMQHRIKEGRGLRLGFALTRSRPLVPDARAPGGVAGAGGGRPAVTPGSGSAGPWCAPPLFSPPPLLFFVHRPVCVGVRRRPLAGLQWSKEGSPSAAGLQVSRRIPGRRSTVPTWPKGLGEGATASLVTGVDEADGGSPSLGKNGGAPQQAAMVRP